jgi:hypothetical protein
MAADVRGATISANWGAWISVATSPPSTPDPVLLRSARSGVLAT